MVPLQIWVFTNSKSLITIRFTLIAFELLVACYPLLEIFPLLPLWSLSLTVVCSRSSTLPFLAICSMLLASHKLLSCCLQLSLQCLLSSSSRLLLTAQILFLAASCMLLYSSLLCYVLLSSLFLPLNHYKKYFFSLYFSNLFLYELGFWDLHIPVWGAIKKAQVTLQSGVLDCVKYRVSASWTCSHVDRVVYYFSVILRQTFSMLRYNSKYMS